MGHLQLSKVNSRGPPLRAERLPAIVVQGLRDFIGGHTYHDGTFHTL